MFPLFLGKTPPRRMIRVPIGTYHDGMVFQNFLTMLLFIASVGVGSGILYRYRGAQGSRSFFRTGVKWQYLPLHETRDSGKGAILKYGRKIEVNVNSGAVAAAFQRRGRPYEDVWMFVFG